MYYQSCTKPAVDENQHRTGEPGERPARGFDQPGMAIGERGGGGRNPGGRAGTGKDETLAQNALRVRKSGLARDG